MKTKQIISSILIAIGGGLIAVFAYSYFNRNNIKTVTEKVVQPVGFAKYTEGGHDLNGFDFTYAAAKTVHAVVNVRTETVEEAPKNPLYEFFYGQRSNEPQQITGIGSGVIISKDGYIVTNNHVVENSDKITVTLNDKREFQAKVIGTDPSTDLAVLKINADNLHYLTYGNSDSLKVGQWVLAVGNPFNLTSTVTAGIVSAKGKDLGIIKDQYHMEAFIQTDAAVNRGNSGGALVDLNGRLVGINTAILSPSGGYAGISFAIPVSIVQKVVSDIIKYGVVQRAFLGVSITDVTAQLVKDKGLDKIEGVYIMDVNEDGAAKAAGIEKGDVILAINGEKVNSPAQLQEQINQFSPNDKVEVLIKRKNKTKQFEVTLRNLQGNTSYVKSGEFNSVLGAKFASVDKKTKENLGISNGVEVTELSDGKLSAEGVKEGFIITKINSKPVNSADDVQKIISGIKGGVYIEGIYPNGVIAYYAFGL